MFEHLDPSTLNDIFQSVILLLVGIGKLKKPKVK